MQFDVIIGNPPYQLDDGGFGTSAGAIYNKFVEQAKTLDPRYLSMVIPARWYAGGKGLDEFRVRMLSDDRIRQLHDFSDSSNVFPGTQIKGGVCYFLWERSNPGLCEVTSYDSGEISSTKKRPLLLPGADVFVRYNQAVPILEKIMMIENGSLDIFKLDESRKFSALVSSRNPFGFSTSFKGKSSEENNSLKLYQNGGIGYVERESVEKGSEAIDSWKIFISAAYGGVNSFPHPVLGKPFVGEPGTVSTETYLYLGTFANENEANNALSYLQTRFFRMLVLLRKPSQHATRQVYEFVPKQDFSKPWTDEKLYKKYGITKNEISFIESMIRPMELGSE